MMVKYASEAAIATVFACYLSLTALPEQLGECAAPTTLTLTFCYDPTALPGQLGDCAALTTLKLRRATMPSRHYPSGSAAA